MNNYALEVMFFRYLLYHFLDKIFYLFLNYTQIFEIVDFLVIFFQDILIKM